MSDELFGLFYLILFLPNEKVHMFEFCDIHPLKKVFKGSLG